MENASETVKVMNKIQFVLTLNYMIYVKKMADGENLFQKAASNSIS